MPEENPQQAHEINIVAPTTPVAPPANPIPATPAPTIPQAAPPVATPISAPPQTATRAPEAIETNNSNIENNLNQQLEAELAKADDDGKKSSIKKIIIIVSAIILLGVGGYFTYSTLFGSSTKTEQEEAELTNKLTTSETTTATETETDETKTDETEEIKNETTKEEETNTGGLKVGAEIPSIDTKSEDMQKLEELVDDLEDNFAAPPALTIEEEKPKDIKTEDTKPEDIHKKVTR